MEESLAYSNFTEEPVLGMKVVLFSNQVMASRSIKEHLFWDYYMLSDFISKVL